MILRSKGSSMLAFLLALFMGFSAGHTAQEPAATETTQAPTTIQDSPTTQDSSATQDSPTTLIVVVGAAGQPEYVEKFSRWADNWAQLAKQQQWNFVKIGDRPAPSDSSPALTDSSPAPTNDAELSSLTDAAKLEQAIVSLKSADGSLDGSQQQNGQQQNSSGKRLWLVLIGHGTAMGSNAKFNLTGPDVTSKQLKAWLDNVTHETVIIDCASSSAPFLVELSAKNRIIVTATRSSGEVNYARFGGYMAEAIADLAADLDHDNEVSLLEAFLKASKDTDRFYGDNARLATEHALLDDNYDRVGTSANFYVGSIATTTASQGKAVDGKRAARVILWSSPDSLRLNAEQAVLREQIESQIDLLRERKSKLAEADYYEQLEALLVELTKIYDQVEPQ